MAGMDIAIGIGAAAAGAAAGAGAAAASAGGAAGAGAGAASPAGGEVCARAAPVTPNQKTEASRLAFDSFILIPFCATPRCPTAAR